MSWTRLDDGWGNKIRSMDLSFPARWHYLELIQWCSRNRLYDGRVRTVDARIASDVDDPFAALDELVKVGLLEVEEKGYRLAKIDEHLPPEYLRDEKRKADQRTRQDRARAHKSGNHSMCLPGSRCLAVTGEVTRDARTVTGQYGEGPALEVSTTRGATATHPGGSSSPAVCDWCHGEGEPNGCPECGEINERGN